MQTITIYEGDDGKYYTSDDKHQVYGYGKTAVESLKDFFKQNVKYLMEGEEHANM